MTAWSAKVVDQLDLLVGEWLYLRDGPAKITPIGSPSRSSGTPSAGPKVALCAVSAIGIFWIGLNVGHM